MVLEKPHQSAANHSCLRQTYQLENAAGSGEIILSPAKDLSSLKTHMGRSKRKGCSRLTPPDVFHAKTLNNTMWFKWPARHNTIKKTRLDQRMPYQPGGGGGRMGREFSCSLVHWWWSITHPPIHPSTHPPTHQGIKSNRKSSNNDPCRLLLGRRSFPSSFLQGDRSIDQSRNENKICCLRP